MTDQNSSVSFNSIDDIDVASLTNQTPAAIKEETVVVEVEVPEENILSVNSISTNDVPEMVAETNVIGEAKEEEEIIAAVKIVEGTPKADTDVISSPKRVIPELEAEIAGDAEEDKAKGKTEEIINTLNSSMQDLTDSIRELNPINDKIKSALDSLQFDPNNIEINNNLTEEPMMLFNQLELLKSVRPDPVFPIIALKSGYKADIAALNNNDKIELRNLSGSATDQTMKLFRLIHSKIRTTSIGKMSFQKFLEITAEEDYETLVYGLFSASFPNATEYNMGCPHCGTEVKLPLLPSQLIEVIDKEKAGDYVATVLANYDKGEEFLKNSLVNQQNRVMLPMSKGVVEIITPTLKGMLDSTRIIDTNKTKYSADLINTAKYIKAIYVLNIEEFQKSGRVQHLPITDTGAILNFISSSDAADLQAIRKSVSATIRSYSIQYRIPKFTCPSTACSKAIDKVHVDLTKLLFFGIVGELTA